MLVPIKILVPTDFSEYLDRALEQELAITKKYWFKAYVLHGERSPPRNIMDRNRRIRPFEESGKDQKP
jgi:hypothetical protein